MYISGREKKVPAPQEGARCREIKQTYYEKTRIKISAVILM
jgi:hypothetical protein